MNPKSKRKITMPNCYDCKHRGTIPGDAHSMCHHPLVGNEDNMFGALVKMASGGTAEAATKLNIRASAHGVRSGWFMWPANFDPCWLENCDGFEKKAKEGGTK